MGVIVIDLGCEVLGVTGAARKERNMSNATLKQPWSVDAGMGLGRGRDRSMHDPAPAGTGQGIFHAVRGAGHLGSGYRRFIKLQLLKL